MTDDKHLPATGTETIAAVASRAVPAEATRPPRLIALVLLTALAVLPVNMIVPSLPQIAATLRADAALVNLAVAGYAIATALTEVIAGALSDRFGRRPVVLVAVAIFIIASLGCASAGSIGVFLLCRALQAAIAACFTVALVMIKETSRESGSRVASKFGYLAMGWALAPMLGPLFGGVLEEQLGWRANFIALAILGAVALVLSLGVLHETSAQVTRPTRYHLAAYGQLLGSARFWAYTLCMACAMGTLYVFLGGAPLAMQQALGGSTARLGLYMGLVPAGFILGSFLSGRFAARTSLARVLIGGRLVTCLGLLVGLILARSGNTQALAFFGPCMCIGIGNGLTMPAANMGVLSLHADLAGTAAGLAAAMTIGGGAVIAAIAGLFLVEAGAVQALLVMMLIPASGALLAACGAAFAVWRTDGLMP